MKSLFLFSVLIIAIVTGFAQTASNFKYQAILRDNNGDVSANKTFGLEISILKGSANGEEIFSETHSITTNDYGLFTIIIGSDNKEDFNEIDWTTGPFFLQTTVNGVKMGTSELMSVPFAVVAQKALSVNHIDYSAIQNMPNFNDTITKYIENLEVSYSKADADNLLQAKADVASLSKVATTGNYEDLQGAKTKVSELENDNGYISSETDPLFTASPANTITNASIALWDSASKNALDNYTKEEIDSLVSNVIVTDSFAKVAVSGSYSDLLDAPTTVSSFSNDMGYISQETDPIFVQSIAANITATDIENWNSKPTTGNYDTLFIIEKDTIYSITVEKDTIVSKDTVYSFSKDTIYIENGTSNVDLSNYYTITQVDDLANTKANSADLSVVATSGSYNDLTDVPAPVEIPVKVSAFENDAMYLTADTTLEESEVDAMVANNGFATKDMNNENITNLATPVDPKDAANKEYVDILLHQLDVLNEILLENGMNGTVADIDGNVYKTIKYNNKIWMAENLRVTRYADGTAIPYVNDAETWTALATADKAYRFYNTEGSDYADYDSVAFGALYTWAAAMNGQSNYDGTEGTIQGACPKGWHIPTFSEWDILVTDLKNKGFGYEGSGSDVGKSVASQYGWNEDFFIGNVGYSQDKNNASMFTGLPSGNITVDGESVSIGDATYWWSSTQSDSNSIYVYGLEYDKDYFVPNYKNKKNGQPVRCVKNAE